MKETSIYRDAKPELKAAFETFIQHPEQFTEDPEVINTVTKVGKLETLALWKLYKSSAKTFLHKNALEQFDELLIEDLKDAKLKPMNAAMLKLVLKHPGAEEFNLEPEMIATIKAFSKAEKKAVFDSMQKELGFIDGAGRAESKHDIGDKVLGILTKFWDVASPILGKVLGVLTEIGTTMLQGLVNDKVDGDIGSQLSHGIGLTGNAFNEGLFKKALVDTPISVEEIDAMGDGS